MIPLTAKIPFHSLLFSFTPFVVGNCSAMAHSALNQTNFNLIKIIFFKIKKALEGEEKIDVRKGIKERTFFRRDTWWKGGSLKRRGRSGSLGLRKQKVVVFKLWGDQS